jgi:hypothetical protein
MMVTLHRIICDGWSLGVLFYEIGNIYGAFAKDQPSPLPDLPIQYRDYVNWQRQQLQADALDAHLAYWKRQLANLPESLNLRPDKPRPIKPTFGGARHTLALSESLTHLLMALCRSEGVTLFIILLAAFKVVLYRISGQSDIVVGCPASTNRDHKETEMLIGLFGNLLPMRTDAGGNPSFRDLLRRVQATTLAATAHQDVPLGRLLGELQQEAGAVPQLPFQVVLAQAIYSLPAFELPGLGVELQSIETGKSKFDLTLWIYESKGILDGAIEYSTDLFDIPAIEQLADSYLKILETAAHAPETHLDSFPLSEGLDNRNGLAIANS